MFSGSSLWLLLFSLLFQKHRFEGKPSNKKTIKSDESTSNSSFSEWFSETQSSFQNWYNQWNNPLLNDKQLAQIGLKLLKQMNYEEAFHYFDKAIKKKQAKGLYYRLRGNCYAEKGDMNKAILDYQTAISLDPEDEKSHSLLTLAFFDTGKPEDAMKEMSALDDYELTTIGDRLADQEKFKEAVICYSQAIEKNPEVAVYHTRRGFCHRKIGNLGLAIRDYEEAIRISPELVCRRIDLSELLLEAGDFKEAKSVLENIEARYDRFTQEETARIAEVRRKIQEMEEKAKQKAKSVEIFEENGDDDEDSFHSNIKKFVRILTI